jgi:hypothetical protein
LNWLVITLILVAAFGPVFWMVPSRSERRLALMRSRARAHGIRVELMQLPDVAADHMARVTAGARRVEPMVMCAAYHLAMPRRARGAPLWRVLRNAAASTGPLPGWQWDSAPCGDPAYWREVGSAFDGLPADALACGATATEVSCWWRERASPEEAEKAVDSLRAALAKLAEVQRVADEAKQFEDADDLGAQGPTDNR